MPPKVRRLRSQVKSAVASALAKAHDHGLAGRRHAYRPLVIGYHRIPVRAEIAIRLTPPEPNLKTIEKIRETLVADPGLPILALD